MGIFALRNAYFNKMFADAVPGLGTCEKKSAVLGLPGPHVVSVPLNPNHSDICRFLSKEDDAYFQVSKNIVMLAKQNPKRSSRTNAPTTPQGGIGKAKVLFGGLLSINRRACRESDEHTFSTMRIRAKEYRKLKRYEESLGVLKELLPLIQESPDRDDSLCTDVIEQLALSLVFLDRWEEVVKLCKQALALRRQRQGFDHYETLRITVRTAECLIRLLQYDEALRLLSGVLPIAKRVLGDEHPLTLESMFGISAAYMGMDQVDVALPLYQEVYLLRQRILGDDHVDTRQVRRILDITASVVR